MMKIGFRGLIIVFSVFIAAGIAHAGEKDILPINPVPEIEDIRVVTGADDDGYVSFIDGISEKAIVIEDRRIKESPDIQYRSSSGRTISRSKFKVGDRVGFKTNSQGEIILLWKAEE